MKRPPIGVIAVAALCILSGAGVVASGIEHFRPERFPRDSLWVVLLGLVAVIAGVFLFRAANWARWLTIAWMAGHVVISIFHEWQELVAHIMLLVLIGWLLFLPKANAWFRTGRGPLTPASAA